MKTKTVIILVGGTALFAGAHYLWSKDPNSAFRMWLRGGLRSDGLPY